MKITRRGFLKAAGGISVALPLLPSMRAHATGTDPKRFVAFCHPNGVYPQTWFPTGDQFDYTMGSTHAGLESLRPHLLWVNGLDMKVAVTGVGEQHQRGLGALLTGQQLLAGPFVGNDGTKAGCAGGISVDQELIKLVGSGSKAASLQLGVHAAERDVSGALSYAGSAQPLLPENDPSIVFRNLLSDVATPPAQLEALRRQRKSVLDLVLDQITSLSGSLSTVERTRLDAHFTLVRDLEQRVTAVASTAPVPQTCSQATSPLPLQTTDIAAMPDISKTQLDLLVLALSCDLVRVATIEYSDVKDHISLPFLGINSDVHNISHMSDDAPERAQLGVRDQWQSQQFGYFVQRLLETATGEGTLLDHTLVFWGSELSAGNTHSHANMPYVFAGHAAGWSMGRSITFQHQPHNDLLVSILQGFGGAYSTFGNPSFCDGPLSGLV